MKNPISPLIGFAVGLLTASSLSAAQPLGQLSLVESFQEPAEVLQIAMRYSRSTTRLSASRTSVPAKMQPAVADSQPGVRACRPPRLIPGQWAKCSRHLSAGR
jgi:hypothetical protein